MTGPLLGEAVGVLFVTCRALAAWVIAAAFVVTVCLYTAVLTGAWAWRAVRRGAAGPLAASQPPEAPDSATTPAKPTAPQRARHDHERKTA